MNVPFRPMFSGFGPGPIPAAPAAAPTTEQNPMGKISDNAAIILAAITDNGGKATAAELRELLPDLTNTDRGAAMTHLKATGKVVSTGATSQIEYRLKGRHNKKDPAAASPPSASTAPAPAAASRPVPTDSFELSAQIAEDRIAGLNGAANPAVLTSAGSALPANTVFLSVPLLAGVSAEVQLIAALDALVDNVGRECGAASLARATSWLASKHQLLEQAQI